MSLTPGWIAQAGATWKLIGKKLGDPFVIGGLAAAASGGSTRDARGNEETMIAVDLRISAIAGKTFFDILSPYVVLRAFGGPVMWKYKGQDEVGGDNYHFQVGGGLLVALPGRFDAFFEGVPLGERAATLGLGYSF